nr:TRAP transporter large permease [uncultured Oscillibacter sp.]
MILLLLVVFVIMLLLGIPVAFSMLGSSLIYVIVGILNGGFLQLTTAIQRVEIAVDSFPLMAIPFFVLAGEFMNSGGITKKIMDFARVCVGHFKGGMAQVAIFASTLFAAMSGSSIACASIFGQMMIPDMERDGYDKPFASAVISCAATIGPIIPPSIVMVVFGVMANCSIGRILIGGVVPGLLMCGGLMLMSYFISKRKDFPTYSRATGKERMLVAKQAILPLLMPIILIGGILTGYFTPTEAAVVAAIYGCILGFAQKQITAKDLPRILFNTALGSARTMFIIGTAGLFGWILTLEQAPKLFSDWMFSLSENRWVILMIINIFLLILGMFMESSAIIIMTTPILVPIVDALGFNIIHFGMVMMVNVMVGCVTPPVGVLMYVTNDIAGVSMKDYLKAQWPLLLSLFAVLLLVTFVPQISLALPDLLMG